MRKIILGSLFVTFLIGCEKEYSVGDVPEDRNPLQGTMTYELNGEKIVTDVKSVVSIVDDNDVKTLTLVGEKFSPDMNSDRSDILSMTINYYEGPKMYTTDNYISANLILGRHFYEPYNPNDLKNYVLVPMGDNESEEETEFIQIDAEGDNIKGKFAFNVVYSNPSNTSQKDTIYIENGMFDIPK